MIRRSFWLTLGAVLGVTGYRRATALVRSVSPAVQAGRAAAFVADVREGMALYMERHHQPGGSTLEGYGERQHVRGRSAPRAGPGTDDDKDGS